MKPEDPTTCTVKCAAVHEPLGQQRPIAPGYDQQILTGQCVLFVGCYPASHHRKRRAVRARTGLTAFFFKLASS